MKFFLILLFCQIVFSSSAYPVAIFLGLSDDCTSTNFISYNIKRILGAEVKCFDLHSFRLAWMMTINDQADIACEMINQDPIFDGDFSIIGLSQGGLIARHLIQKCNLKGKVKRYISFSTPQMGISDLHQFKCGFFCIVTQKLFRKLTYKEILNYNVGPAGFYKNQFEIDTYLKYNQFLADLNNEREEKNPIYKEKILSLEKMLLIINAGDELVTPVSSGWFDSYHENSNKINHNVFSEFYLNDYLGIKELQEKFGVSYSMFEGKHIDFTSSEIYDYIFPILR